MNRAFLGLSARALGLWALFIVVLLVAASMWLFGWGFFQRETAGFRGETDQIEQISADADYRIAAYEEFYDRCWAVVELEAQITLAQAAVDAEATDWGREEARRNLLALQNMRIELITAYNSDAAKEDTAANFHASDLPSELDIDIEETSCSAS